MRIGVVQDRFELAGGEQRIERYQLGACGQRAEGGHACLDRVAQQGRDTLTAGPQRLQFVREPGHARQVVRVVEPSLPVHQCLDRRSLRRRGGKHVHHGRMNRGQRHGVPGCHGFALSPR